MKKSGRAGKIRIKAIISASLLLAALFLSATARKAPGFAQWYSTHLYPLWVGSIGRIMGYLPFSVSEMLICFLLLGIILCGVRTLVKKGKQTSGKCTEEKPCREWGWKIIRRHGKQTSGKDAEAKSYREWGWNILLLAAALWFLYVANCGINYQRDSFSECSGIGAKEYTAEELKEVCQWLTRKVGDYSSSVARGQDGGMVLDLPLEENAIAAMEALGQEYPELEGYYPRPKKLLNSWFMSVQNLTGVYLPFTIEANYNGDIQDYNIPFTACHELSHLRGFMQEQEANFIAFLACIGSDKEAFVYSGYLMGWVQCMNVLYRADYDAWEEVRGQLPPEVEQDLRLNREFWARYDGRIAEVSNRVNDTYLKANGQADGVKSYNRMVDLIVGWYYL